MKQSEIDEIKNHCKYSPIGFYTPMSVLRVINHFEQKLTETNHSLTTGRDEKILLQEKLNQLIAGNKASLPPEVAQAIERLKAAGFSNYGIIACSDQTSVLGRDYSSEVIADLMSIKKFPLTDLLIKGLVNGYTVVETPQERIKRGVQAIYEKWTTIPTSGDDQKDGEDLAERITKFVSSELKL
ncbi:hypothetical protein [Brevibacillus brevis]|uniref:hypothetical protein n=1 Tax=Brevibacillus brevis TaxID=1393 RepID=UPI001C8F08EB|nr:hypothetical protein [Brevibacillus brevis]MBY0088428.1 hypothetical protein [Brevibacillus brevis]